MHCKVKQKKQGSITESRKSVISAMREKAANLEPHDCRAVQLLQRDARHGQGEYLKIQCMPCTWHQKMVIAWDEVVRVWRDMAPGLVFCDTSLHIHPCYYRGRILWKRRGKSGEGEHWFCVALWLSMPCNMPIPSNKLAECIQHIREAQSHSFCRKITPWPTKVLPYSRNREEFDMYLITMGHMMRVCIRVEYAQAKWPWNCSIISYGIGPRTD